MCEFESATNQVSVSLNHSLYRFVLNEKNTFREMRDASALTWFGTGSLSHEVDIV